MYWGYGIFGFSPCFTHFYLFAHNFLLIFTTSTLFLRRFLPTMETREGRGDVANQPNCGPSTFQCY